MTDTMTFIDIRGFGEPDVLTPAQGALPPVGERQLLVRVAAAGINGPDLLQRRGNYAPPAGASHVLGLELAGTVAATGPGVRRYEPGDLVCALVTGGAYAEYAVVPEEQALPIPAGLSLLEAAALPENYFTVWTNVFERGGLREGETLLVHGGAGGIGNTAIQLAVAYGATVFTTVSDEEKARAVRTLGASRAINYKTEDFVEVVKAETGGAGVDLILDMVGGSYVARNLEAAAMEGRIVQIAWLEGAEINLNFMPIILKRLTWTGSTLRARSIAQKAAIARQLEERVWPMLASGKIKPLIYATFPLKEAAAAHALMEKQAHIGKILLTMDQ